MRSDTIRVGQAFLPASYPEQAGKNACRTKTNGCGVTPTAR
jgi:hypothetical protein